MKLTSLTIAPTHSWERAGKKNPMKAVVKLESEGSTVECVLSESSMLLMLDLCAQEIADQAEKRVQEFRSAVTEIEGRKSTALIEG